MKFQYKIQNSYEQRTSLSFRLIEKHGQMIPAILQLDIRNIQHKEIPDRLLKSQKMLIRDSISVQELFIILKQQYSQYMTSRDGLFIFISGNKLLSNSFSKSLKEIYLQNQDNDGWLYLEVRLQEKSG
ncbi:unnamed protein product [Paramecium octaurelia]|uniref:Autophagy-related protein n=1 Tax=Paramecium octaurelia TaxID=43137 RepID=A0A8S1SWS4_PAROT|nr:unnamed protein product [Paramecium octaurelia]